MKMVGQALVLGVIIFFVAGCTTDEPPVLYRTAGTGAKQTEVLYISPFIALVKYQSSYSICRLQWLNDPELADSTGDKFDIDQYFASSIRSMSQSAAKGLLFGYGSHQLPPPMTVNPTNGLLVQAVNETQPYADVFFVITYDRVLYFHTEEELNNYSQKVWGISPPVLIPISDFFEKAKIRNHQSWAGDILFDVHPR